MTLIHLLPLSAYRRFRAEGGPLVPDSLAEVGFTHCSPDEAVALAVANLFFAGLSEPLVAVWLDPLSLTAPVRYEAADPAPPPGVGADTLFPHVYGALDAVAVVRFGVARRDGAGRYVALVGG